MTLLYLLRYVNNYFYSAGAGGVHPRMPASCSNPKTPQGHIKLYVLCFGDDFHSAVFFLTLHAAHGCLTVFKNGVHVAAVTLWAI